MAAEDELTDKQRRFVDEYCETLNATQSYIRAGYSPNAARVSASQLLSRPNIRAIVDASLAHRKAAREADIERIRRELEIIAYFDLADAVEVDERGVLKVKDLASLPPEVRRAIGEIVQTTTERFEGGKDGASLIEKVRTSVKGHSKTKALELLMTHFGMNAPQEVKHTGEVAITGAKQALVGKLDELRSRVGAKPSGDAGGEPEASG